MYHPLLNEIVDNACGVLLAKGNGIGGAIKTTAFSLCPQIRRRMRALHNHLVVMKDAESKNLDNLARLASARLTSYLAKDLSRSLVRPSSDSIRDVIVRKKADLAFRSFKESLVN